MLSDINILYKYKYIRYKGKKNKILTNGRLMESLTKEIKAKSLYIIYKQHLNIN